ncbi:hypothetical protein ACRJ4W_03360 [Streptomyces sp. GLT-R25]
MDGRIVATISVVQDHTTAAALYDPKDTFNEAVAAWCAQASGGSATCPRRCCH